jgi:acyl dehydratase
MIEIPAELLGREVDLGMVTVTTEMIAAYAAAVGDASADTGAAEEAPPTFCLALRRGMTPEIPLPPELFGVYGGHDLEFHRPIRAGATYRISGRIADVYEKIGRSGTLTIVVREATIRDVTGQVAARIVERQIVRQRPSVRSTPSRV